MADIMRAQAKDANVCIINHYTKGGYLMKNATKLLAVLLSATLLTGLTACGSTADSEPETAAEEGAVTETVEESGETAVETDDDTIYFAAVGPLTGTQADFGKHALWGAQVAVNEINEAGGILGKKVDIKSYDDENVAEKAAAAAELIVSDDSIVAVAAAHYSSSIALVGGPIYQESGIPAISNSASHPDYSAIGDYIFRNNLTEEDEFRFAFQMPVVAGAKKVAIVSLMSDFGQLVTDDLVAMADEYGEQLGFEIVCESYFTDGTVDFAPNIAEVTSSGADTIIFSAEYNNLAAFAQQLRKTDTTTQIIGLMTTYNGELISLAGDAVEGMYLYSCFDPNSDDELVQNFVAEYVEANGMQPDFVAANAYDSVYMLKAAIEKAGSTDREAIKDALYEVEFTGTQGTLKFKENGDVEKVAVAFQIQNGEFVGLPGAFKLWDDFIGQ